MRKSTQSYHDLQGHPEFPSLIDFPCSDLWQEHYARQGYYGGHSRGAQPPAQKLVKEVRLLQEENAAIFIENRILRARLKRQQGQDGSGQKGSKEMRNGYEPSP